MSAKGVALEPFTFAVDVMLFFPDRRANFQLFDHVLRSFVRLLAVLRTDGDNHGTIANFEATRAVNGRDMKVGAPVGLRFDRDFFQRLFGEWNKWNRSSAPSLGDPDLCYARVRGRRLRRRDFRQHGRSRDQESRESLVR